MCEADPEPIKVATSEDAKTVASLLAQLSFSAPPFAHADLDVMAADPATTILAARAREEIVGIATLVVCRVATGVRAFIEDVVVSDAHRGKGLGERLVRAPIDQAACPGVQKIDLTSQPCRETASKLYQRLVFERRQTNVDRLILSTKRLCHDGENPCQRLPSGQSCPLQRIGQNHYPSDPRSMEARGATYLDMSRVDSRVQRTAPTCRNLGRAVWSGGSHRKCSGVRSHGRGCDRPLCRLRAGCPCAGARAWLPVCSAG